MKSHRHSGREAVEIPGGEYARGHHSHSLFEDHGCSVASHHRCSGLAPACSCDSVIDGASSRRECTCGRVQARVGSSGPWDTSLIETAAPGIL